ncbi:hypothetical protein FHP29_14475 [Nocardioides albidus]|uniref:Glycosyl hydrolase family 98 putative carbohydrate-binding module domain-containing protein n=1 Tax=Nocardioides albidus TaxID=1517589 RepID=A0A5C4VRC2_9ACTN|nr:hypothetical protein FHP29_14475 [Nocardioides albidus]
MPLYVNASWEDVRSLKVRKRKTVFHEVVTDLNNARYRVVVGRRAGKAVKSKPVSVTVWRWIPLRSISSYLSTSGAVFGETNLNGSRYKAWGAASYSHAGVWESRFTPGRRCRAFSGVLGLADSSPEGSSAVIHINADDVPVYDSPALTPGMDVRVQLPLPSPYRIGIEAVDTSPGDIDSFPSIGDPALLCTGVS